MASISKKYYNQKQNIITLKKYYYNQKKYSRTGEGRKERRNEGNVFIICANVCYAPACPNSPKIRFMVKYPSPGGWRGDTWYIISTRSI